MDADSNYILNLCDSLLRQTSFREYRFPFLVGDSGRTLPVDAYYPNLELVIELHERPEAVSSASAPNSSAPSSAQRLYDQRRRDVLPEYGISLVELYSADFQYDGQGRLKRFPETIRSVLQRRLELFVSAEEVALVRN